jgi:transposase
MPHSYFPIRPYTLKELASLYHVSKETFRGWLSKFKDEIGERDGRIYSIAQVEIIAKRLGWPYIPKY